MHYLSHRDALDYVQREAGLSRDTFDSNIRPRLLERRYGERVVRFSKLAIDQALADPTFEEGSMKLPRRRTLKDALEHVWETEWQRQKGSRQQKRLVDALILDIGSWVLKRIKYDDLEEWVSKQRKAGLKEATIARRLSAIMKALRLAKTKEWIASVPDKPPLSVSNNLTYRWLSDDEEALLLDACGDRVVLYHTIRVLIYTGCRLSELMKVRPEDVVEDGVVFLDRKTGGNLKVPLTAHAKESIAFLLSNLWWKHWTRMMHDSDKSLRDIGLETLRSRLSREFRKICELAGLKDVTIHTCRHTFGSRLAQRGVPMHVIQQLMGHRDITVTSRRYAHLAPSTFQSAVSVLERQESDNVVPFDKQRKNEG